MSNVGRGRALFAEIQQEESDDSHRLGPRHVPSKGPDPSARRLRTEEPRSGSRQAAGSSSLRERRYEPDSRSPSPPERDTRDRHQQRRTESREQESRQQSSSRLNRATSDEDLSKKFDRLLEDEREPVIMRGESGEKTRNVVNYLKLDTELGSGVYLYEVEFNPIQDSKGFKISMIKKHRSKLFNGLIFDGRMLYMPIKTKDRITTFSSEHPHDGSRIQIKITFIKKKHFRECPIVFNVLFKQIMYEMQMVDFGRKYFDPEAANEIPEYHLEIWPGYVTSVSDFEGGLMLNLDISHRILRSESILDKIKDLQRTKGNMFMDYVRKEFLGQSVLTRYNHKIYTIEDIDFDASPRSTFEKQGNEISYVTYYKQQYGLEIRDQNQPLLIVKMKGDNPKHDKNKKDRIVYLVPSLCSMTGLSDEMTNDFHLMKQVSAAINSSPKERINAMRKFVNNVNNNPNAKEILSGWGIILNPDAVEVDSRVLDTETLIFGKNRTVTPMNCDWKSAITKNPVLNPIDILNWTILHTQKDSRYTNEFAKGMMDFCPAVGINIRSPNIVCLKNDTINAYIEGLKKSFNSNLDIVVCICPTSRDDRYAAIKKVCCVDLAIPSQVVNSMTLNKKAAPTIIKNIALQMNCKLGGSLWTVRIPLKQSMFIGIDTYHSKNKNVNSVTAFVASYNSHLTKWYSSVTIQKPGQEMSDNLQLAFKNALKQYKKFNGELPSKIFVYRDGVGNSMLKAVMDFEISQMEECLKDISPDYKPSMTVIIVQKRISTRIYTRTHGGEYVNPKPGTVVDSAVTNKYMYDFYLVSHSSGRGTALPTHYIVIKDDSGLSPDNIQKLSYKLCHLYFNWSGTIRNPAPCQYAHKLCNLVGESIKEEVHPELSDKLYFL